MSCISCGKDSERYHKSFVKASKGALRVASAPVYPNPSQYSGAIMTCEKFAFPISRYKEKLYNITN